MTRHRLSTAAGVLRLVGVLVMDRNRLLAAGGDAPPPAVPARRRGTAGRALGEVALTGAALIGLASAILTVTATASGIRPLVVRSGSMEPTIPTGSMVLVRHVPVADVVVGDVVAVDRPDHSRVTHRVVVVEHRGGVARLTLKGDANDDPDPFPVTATHVDRLAWQIPAVGQFGAWLATPPGGFVLGSLLTLALVGTRRAGRTRYRACAA